MRDKFSNYNKMKNKTENIDNKQGNRVLQCVSGNILAIANGWGEASTFYKVGSHYEKVEIAKIQKEKKVLGAGYYNDLTINCYVGYSGDDTKLFEINDGVNVEIRYCP